MGVIRGGGGWWEGGVRSSISILGAEEYRHRRVALQTGNDALYYTNRLEVSTKKRSFIGSDFLNA